jgi:tripartite-type tricarboxylate transporter receptor subunit TctC
MIAKRLISLAVSCAVLAAGFLGSAVVNRAAAQDWPTRSVTMIVPFAAGGALDALGRIIASRLGEILGRKIIIENVAGAGGMTGASRAAKAPPDGYVFVLGNVATHAMNSALYKNPLYNAATDFAPVVLIAETPQVLVTRADLPVSNLQEFMRYAKANQAKMQFASAGAGSATHLACALLNTAIGINVTHIPYRGGAPAMQDLIAGRTDYMCPNAPLAIPQVQANQVKAIAILSKNRSSIWPTLASAQEQGLDGFEYNNWNAFFLSRGAPPAIIQKLHDATVAAMETPSVQQRLKDIGAEVVLPERRSPEYLQKFVESEIEKWSVPIRAGRLTGE